MKAKKIIRLSATPEGFGQSPDKLVPDMFISELPTQHTHEYFQDEELGLYVGVWDTTDMIETAGPYPCDEFMWLLEGEAAIRNCKTGEMETAIAGEPFVIPKGYNCQWHQAGRMPGGAAGKLLSLQQHHVADTAFCQVIGDGTSDNATANNNHPGPGWMRGIVQIRG